VSFALYYEEGYKRDIASVNGYYELAKFCMAVGGPALRNFIETGESQQIEEVRNDIVQALPSASDKDIRTTLEGLLEGLKGVQDIAIISDY
jgi:hypothetical protein